MIQIFYIKQKKLRFIPLIVLFFQVLNQTIQFILVIISPNNQHPSHLFQFQCIQGLDLISIEISNIFFFYYYKIYFHKITITRFVYVTIKNYFSLLTKH